MRLMDLFEIDSTDFTKKKPQSVRDELRRRKKHENVEDNEKTLDVKTDGGQDSNSTRKGTGGVE